MRGSSAAREERRRAAAGDAHAAHAARVELGARRDVVDGPHDVPHAPADHRLPDQQRAAGRRLTALSAARPRRALIGSRRQPNAIGSIATAARPASTTWSAKSCW